MAVRLGSVDVGTLAVDGMKLQSLASGRSSERGRLAELHRASVATVRKLRARSKRTRRRRSVGSRRASWRRQDRARRLAKARKAHAKIEERRDEQAAEQRRKEGRKDHDPARASLSDPEARIMKMGDGSYRAAYNVRSRPPPRAHVVGVSVTDRGADYAS